MKNTKRLLAVLLALVMALSCLAGISFADSKREQPAAEGETETAQPAEGRGFKSNSFRLNNSYQYADDEIVNAIVLLKGKAPAELPEAQRSAAGSRVAAQHNTLRNAMKNAGISYKVEYEYDSLLNGLAISVAYGDLDKIAALDNVDAVYIANQYAAPVMEPATRMASSNVMTGTADFQNAGYDGKGMVIAVLDTGITPQHEAFQVYGDKLGEVALDKETAEAFIGEKEYGTYLSDKIPFSYDYYEHDDDATDDRSGHGTHVAGIAAGYAETKEGEITFCGTAPFAQIVALKIFSSGSTTTTNSGVYFAALEDCYELGVDVINMSIGAPNGFTYDEELENEVFGNIYEILEENGIICSVSAGNEYSMAQNASNWTGGGYVNSEYADYGIVGTPSTYDGNLSVASLENAEYPANVLTAGDREIPYYDSGAPQFVNAMGGKEDLEFVVIDGLGEPEDFVGVDVAGKVALISRGGITFQEKVLNAAKAGAIAAIIYNNQDGVIFMAIDDYKIPAASITQEDGEYLISIAEMPEVEEPDSLVRNARSGKLSVDRKAPTARKATEDRRDLAGLKAARDAELTSYYWTDVIEDEDELILTFEYIDENVVYAVSTTPNGNGLTPVEVELTVTEDYDYIINADPDAFAFTAYYNEGGNLLLVSADGKYLTSGATGNSLTLADEPNDYSLWEIEEVTEEDDGEIYTVGYYFKNVNAEYNDSQQYIEYYNGKVTTYGFNSNYQERYLLYFYVAGSTGPVDPPVPPENLITGWYFESEDELTDWNLLDKDEDGFNWNLDLNYEESIPYEGDGSIYSESYHNNESGTGGIVLEPDNWAITPAINLEGIEEAYLSLWAIGVDKDYAEEVFAIYAGASADPDAMTKLTDDITASGDYQQIVADLSDFAGETIYVAIRHYNVSDMFRLSIDNVEICKGEVPVLTAALENAVAAAEALNPEGYTEESYALVAAALQAANAVLENPDATQADVDAALAELNAAIEALVRVLPTDELGGEAVYGWYFEKEDELEDWSVLDDDEDGYAWYWENDDAESAYEGDGYLYSYSWYFDALTPDDWAFTPAIDLTGIDDAVLSLFYAAMSPEYPENFQIYVGEEADPEEMLPVSDVITTGDEYQQLVVDLSAYANKTIYVAIRHYDVTDQFALCIDMVEIRTGTTYEPPEPVIRPVGKMSFPEGTVIIENPDGWKMSDFSSWGATPSLTLKPLITGVGGDVYSASFLTENGYEVMSGTSMAAPNVTGMMANVSEYIDANIANGAKAENPFEDVEDGRFYYDAVLWAINQDPVVTNGIDETHFKPENECTRGQVVTFLWRAMGEPEPASTETDFVDIVEGAYYFKAVLWAVEKGITKGVSATEFGPDNPCTRGQVVTFLYRTLGEPAVNTTECAFEDVDPNAYYYKAMLWAVENGVTKGTSDTTFAPGNVCNRGQVVTFLYRALEDETAPAGEPLTKVERAELAEALAESSALVLYDEYGTFYSPRKQGSGLANMDLLTAANAYITEPVQNLFDNADGEFEFTFTVKDIYGEGGTYELTPIVQTDYPVQANMGSEDEPDIRTYNSLSTLELATEPYEIEGEEYPADVEVEAPETVTVAPFGETEVTVRIKLTDATRAYLDEMFPNGCYVEGFILLDRYEEIAVRDGEEPVLACVEEIHATYMGFYGDWTDGSILEEHDWREIVDVNNWLNNTPADADGNTYADYGYTYLDAVDFEVTTDVNTAYALNYAYLQEGQLYGGYAGDNLYGYDPELAYSGDRIAIAPGTGITDTIYTMPYQLRNARHLIMVATDAETGEVYYVDDSPYLPRASYDDENGYWEASGSFVFDGTDAEGNYLPNGTKVNMTYYANLDYGEDELGAIIGEEGDYSKLLEEAEDFVVWEIPVTIDTEGPTLVGEPVIDKEAGTVTIKVKDNGYVAAVFAADMYGDTYDAAYLGEDEAGAETELTFEYPEGATLVKFYIADYATNETAAVAFIEEPTWVTVNFAYPDGTAESYEAYVGEDIYMPIPACEVDKGEYAGFWLDYDIGDADADTLSQYNIFWSDEATIVTEDMDDIVFYPVYLVTEEGEWTLIDADGDGYGWEKRTTEDSAYEGTGCMTSASYVNGFGAVTPDNWAITSAIDLTSLNEATLSLYYAGQDPNWAAENFTIYVGEEADPDAMAPVTEMITATGEYQQLTVDLSAYAGKTIYVGIRHHDVTDMFMLNIDNVEILSGEDAVYVWDFEDDTELGSFYYTTQPNGGETPPEPVLFPYTKLSVDQLDDEEDVIIVNPAEMKAISNSDSDVESYPERYRLGVDVALEEDGRIWTDAEDIVWHMVKDENGYKFVDADGKALSVPSGYNNLVLDSDCIYWDIVDAGDGNVYLISTTSVGTSGDPRGIEFYQGKFTTFYASESNLASNQAAFTLQLFCGPKG